MKTILSNKTTNFYRNFLFTVCAVFLLLDPVNVWGQTTISSQDFESSPATPTLTFTNTNGGNSTGTNGGSGIPASANLFVGGSRGWQANNTTSTLTFANQSLSGYTNAFINFRLAGMSVNGTNGIDAADIVTVSISVDGGTSYSSELTIAGSGANQRWDFAATGTSTITYDGNNVPTAFTSSTGSGGISSVTINIPNSNSQVRVRIAMLNNDANERWVIDDVIVRGTAAATPTISTTGTLSAVNTTYGTASASPSSFSVSGTNMTAGILVTPPAGFEVSTTLGSGYGSTITVGSTGTIASTTVYVRLAATTIPGTYSGNIVLSSTGATSVNVATVSSTVSTKVLTISGLTGVNKTYDATTSASSTGTATLVGIVGSDVVTLGGSSSLSFANATVGNAKSISVTGYSLGGAQAARYSLTQPSLTGDITTKALTIAADDVSKIAGVLITGGAGSTAFSSSGLVGGQTIGSVTIAYGSAGSSTGDGATAGVYSNQVIPSVATGGTFTASNYSITYVAGTITVTPATSTPTISASGTLTAVSSTYGTASGNTTFSVSGSSLTNNIVITPPAGFEVSISSGSGFGTSLTLTQTAGVVSSTTIYMRLAATTNVGTYSGYVVLSSTGATNADVAAVSSTVNPATLTITGLSASGKTYDGNTTVSVSGTAAFSGLQNGESFTPSGSVTWAFPSANVGLQTLTRTGSILAPNSNYTVTQPSLSATITAKALTIASATGNNKVYDNTTTATFTGTLTGIVSPDVVTFAGTGTFASVNVGTGIAITSTATLGGANVGNYTLTQPTGIAANITAKSLTITANNVTKEIGATLTGGTGSIAFTSSGLLAGQTIGSVTLTYGTGASAGDAVGTYSNQVTPSSATGGTFLASNYSISYISGNITVQNTTAVVISSLCSPFTENFNTLASSGTSSTTATGWYFNESGSNANVIYSAGTGSDNAGDSYSFGSASNSDRSFGGLRSGSLIPTIGAKFLNNTGSTINALTLSFTGETWRVGVASRSDRLDFQYSTNATSLTTGTWTDVDNLDYANPGQGATGSASLQHSASISSGISSLSIANGATFWIRWSDFDATGADDGMGVDDFSITACQCASPDALAFVQQPTNVSQGLAMTPSVTVKAICSSSGGTANSYTGNITLTASGGGCGYVSQTVTAVNGVATFDNIVFTRSTQTGLTLTASASALTNAVSSTFNVTSGGGISTSTDIRNDNFSGSTPAWTWTSVAASDGSGGTSGNDVTGVTTAGSNTYLRKSYSANNTSSEKGTKSTITFANTTSLSSYNTLKFTFKIASLNSSGNVTACNGCGVDGPDSLFIETSVDGGTAWQRILTHVGASDKLFAFGGSVLSLTYGTNTILSASSTQSAFSVSIPSGTSQFQFRMIARNNRTGENWCIDDVKLVGESYSGTVTSPLPTVSAFGATNVCVGGSAYLYSSLSNAVGALTYNWAPATGLSATNTSDVTATLNGTQSYTVTITDGDNCIASSNAVTVTVDSPSTPAGDWLGTYSNDWFDCRNWKGKEVPSTSTDVTILSGTTYSPVIAQAGANCRALTIQNAAILTVNDPSSALDVYGAYTNNGSLSHTNGDITLTGTAAYNADCGTSSPFYNLRINNSSSEGITLLNSDMVISNQLSLVDGVITSNNNKVITTSSNASDLFHTSGNASFIFGNLRRFIASNTSVYELPVGLSSETFGYRRADFINNNIIGVNYIDASVRSITETGNNIDSRLATSQIGSSLTDVIGSSIWSLVPNVSPSSGKYGVNLYVANLGLSAMDDNTFCPVKRNDNSIDYADWSTFEQSTTIPPAGSQGRIYDSGNGYAQRLGYSSFSEHAFGKTPSMQPLPVQLTLFKTSCNEKSDALINWTTATETNSDYFEVEVSTDLVSWSEVAHANAAGNSSSKREYVIVDNLSRGLRYYRLVQVDFDGKQRIYDPISLNCGDSESVFLIYPNPTSGDFVVSIQNEKLSGEIAVTLNTADGKFISTKTSEAKAGMQSIYFENNQLPTGIYFVNVIDQFGNQFSGKIVVR